MEQRRASDDHLRRLKPPESQPPPQQPPQKCPRCDSLNTKFCYYNNYSLSQPRYFCKTCRRYWTQGGTLRNVPVGGGCRKGKRAKPSPQIGESPSFVTRSESSAPQIQLGQNNLGLPMPNSRYPGGGFLSSLAAMQSFSQIPPPPQPYNTTTTTTNQQSLNVVGSQFGTSSNLDLLRGFNSSSATTTTDHSQQEAQFYQLEQNPFEIQPNRALTNLWSQTQLLNSANTNPNNYWGSTAATASSATTTAANNNSSTSGSSSLNPTPWPDLPADYGNPP